MNTDGFRAWHSIYWGLAYFLILSVLSCALPATAQFTTAQLSGTVVDSSGLQVQGATVNVVQQGTAYTQTTTTVKESMVGHRPHPGVSGQWFNPADFTENAIGTFGNTGKNTLRGPGFFNTDMAATKNTKIGDRVTLRLLAELFNVTNHPNFAAPANYVGSPGFGQIGGTLGSNAYGGPTSYGTAQPRTMQFGVKTTF